MVVATKQITIAHSPDSDDAFMFYALAKGKIETRGLKVKQVLKDIQSLNVDAKTGVYEVSAISFAVFPEIADRYALMPCGASMGLNYGPVIVAKRPMARIELRKCKLAIPGKLTTAFLVARLYEADLNVVEMPFDKIPDAVAQDEVDAGLLIHEGQLTYADMGLTKVVDLGEWWYEKFQLPLPLGGNVIRKDLGEKVIRDTTLMMQESIRYSLEHREAALEYAMQYARELNKTQANKFVGMYVNDLTVDYGKDGRKALIKLFELAFENRLIDKPVKVEFVTI
jgi:1,4-dihydroxy-6-naphthoate synthase